MTTLNSLNFHKILLKGVYFIPIFIILSFLPYSFISSISILDKVIILMFPPEILGDISISLSILRQKIVISIVIMFVINICSILWKKKDIFDFILKTQSSITNIRLKLIIKEIIYLLSGLLFVYVYFRDLSVDDFGIYAVLKLSLIWIYLLATVANIIILKNSGYTFFDHILKIKNIVLS